MVLSNLLATNITSYQHLSMFICHLFIDGNFHTGHILQDPNNFDVHLITEIDSICPRIIPWIMTDVTQPFTLPWKPKERTDHILQLVFFDLEHVPDEIVNFKIIMASYCLFVMPTHIVESVIVLEKLKSVFKTDVLILDHSPDNTLEVFAVPGARDDRQTMIISQNQNANLNQQNLFNMTFGRIDRNRSIAIHFFPSSQCEKQKHILAMQKLWRGHAFFVNFFASHLNGGRINLLKDSCDRVFDDFELQASECKSQPFYKEVTTDYKPIAGESL